MSEPTNTPQTIADVLAGHAAVRDAAAALDWVACALDQDGEIDPPNTTQTGRPRSHLWDIDAFGLHATGFTKTEAVLNWLRVARNVTGAAA